MTGQTRGNMKITFESGKDITSVTKAGPTYTFTTGGQTFSLSNEGVGNLLQIINLEEEGMERVTTSTLIFKTTSEGRTLLNEDWKVTFSDASWETLKPLVTAITDIELLA